MPYGDSTKVRLAPAGRVSIAPAGTAMPATVAATLNAAFKELGYLNEEGVSITPSIDTNAIRAWQSAVPIKTTLTSVGMQAKFTMMQITQDTTAEYFFGSVWSNSLGNGLLTISSNPNLGERAMVIEWNDDKAVPNTYRLCIPRGFITDHDAMQLQRTEATALGVTFEFLDSNGEVAHILTNNADLVPAT